MESRDVPFIDYLERLRDTEDRGALAALRRGLGQPPGTAREMFPYVMRWLPAQASLAREEAHYLIAALFAFHPQPGGTGNLGTSFAAARDPQGDNTAIERRFAALLAADREDLPFYLRQAISFLKAKERPVNWRQLFNDIQAWDRPQASVQRQWARAFWGQQS